MPHKSRVKFRPKTKTILLYVANAIASAIILAIFFRSCDTAQNYLLDEPTQRLIGQVDKLETTDLRIGSVMAVDIDGSGNEAVAVLLVPRQTWLDAIGSTEVDPEPFRTAQPELVI